MKKRVMTGYDKMMTCFTYMFFGFSMPIYASDFPISEDLLMLIARFVFAILMLKALMSLFDHAAYGIRNFLENMGSGNLSERAEERKAMREQAKERRRQQREYSKQQAERDEAFGLNVALMTLKAFEQFCFFWNRVAEKAKYAYSRIKSKVQDMRARHLEKKAEREQRKREKLSKKFDINKMG